MGREGGDEKDIVDLISYFFYSSVPNLNCPVAAT
jgi:hypothetical protein